MGILGIVVSLVVFQAQINIRGEVLDARTHEPIAKASVSIRDQKLEAVTNDSGHFEIHDVAAGDVELSVTTVGYGLITRRIQLSPGVDSEIEFLLGQEASRLVEEITVTAPVFEPFETNAASEHTLNNSELKNLSGVLVDDPLRSVQTLPGVATGDDFNPDFSVRGFGFGTVGFYLDGVLTHSPFHTVRDIRDGGALTIVNGDLLDSVSLISSGAPAKYGDRTGAILNVQTRDGSANRFLGRANLSATGFSFTGEGPLTRSKKASWILSGRKSYLDYVINRVTEEPTFVFSFKDLQGKLSLQPSDRHQLHITALVGYSGLNRDRILDQLGINSLRNGNAQTHIYSLRWRWLPTESSLVQSIVYLSKENADNSNRTNESLFESNLQHIGVRQDASIKIAPQHHVGAGYLLRHMKENSTRRRASQLSGFQAISQFAGEAWQSGAYLEDTWSTPSSRLAITAGARFDYFEQTREKIVLPRANVAFAPGPGTRITAAYGQYAQFPDFEQMLGEFPNPGLQAERSTHYSAGFEQLLSERTRFRLELYDQEVHGLIFAPEIEWRMSAGQILAPSRGSALRNSVRGYSRGIELFVQRRSANNVSGWVSYSYGRARLNDTRTGLHFDSDYDQRHTFNAYGSYRLSQTLNLSSKFRYGSGYPVAGFYRSQEGNLYFSNERNSARVPVYARWDARVNKAFLFHHWKLTLYAEVVNILNRRHIHYTELDGFDSNTGRVFLDYNSLLPIIPTAGVTIEF